MKLVWIFVAAFLVVVVLDVASAQAKKKSSSKKKKTTPKKAVKNPVRKPVKKQTSKKPARRPTQKPHLLGGSNAPLPPNLFYSPVPVGPLGGTSRLIVPDEETSDDYTQNKNGEYFTENPNIYEVYEPSDYPIGGGYPNLPDYNNGNTPIGSSGGSINFPGNTNDYDYDGNQYDGGGDENSEDYWELPNNSGKHNNGYGHNKPPNGGWHNRPGRPNRGGGYGYGNKFNNGPGNPTNGNFEGFQKNREKHTYGGRYDYNRRRYGRYQNNRGRRYNGGRNHRKNYRWDTYDYSDDFYRSANTNRSSGQNQNYNSSGFGNTKKHSVNAGNGRNKRSVSGTNGNAIDVPFHTFRDFLKRFAEQTKANCLFVYVNVPRDNNNNAEEPLPEEQARRKPKIFRPKVAPPPKNKRQRLGATPKEMRRVGKMDNNQKKVENDTPNTPMT